MANPSYEHFIRPPKGFLYINWPELWRYRDLFIVLAWRDIAVRYKQTALGVLWALFQPIITMVIFSFIFNRMAGIKSGDGTPYPIFLFVGLLLWQFFSNTLSNAAHSLVANALLIQKTYFPRLALPAATAATALVDLGIASLVLIAMMIYYGFRPHLIGIVILPVLLFCAITAAMGLGLLLAAVNVKFRDVRHALPFFIQILMYITPVIYPVSMIDKYPIVKWLMLILNPISGVITNARAGILGQSPIDWLMLGITLVMSIVHFVCGLYYFRNTERYFADII